MPEIDPRTPVIVGAGQVTVREGAADPDRTPLEMMAGAVGEAALDAGAAGLPAEARMWIASAGVFRYVDPARLVAQRHGVTEGQFRLTNFGGNLPQAAVAHVASLIQAGDLDVGVVMGGEAERNRRLMVAEGLHLDSGGPDIEPAPRYGGESPIPSDLELEVGAGVPAVAYALFESALRAHRGETLADNESILGELWARFSRVAQHNPHAWNQDETTASQIRTPSAENRLVAYPYTKAMCANPQVDMGAAVIVCSVERARAHGIPTERWVFPHSSATGHDTTELLARDELWQVHAIAPVGRAALSHAEIDIDDVAHVDLYSCFPSIVRMTASALGLDEQRPLTVTGGLNFGGGPLNNATLHAVAAMVGQLRANTGSRGLVHGNGGVATKHSIGLYGTEPPVRVFADLDVQTTIDTRARRPEPDHVGPGVVVACTVVHDRAGPGSALAVLRTPSGGRTFAVTRQPDLMATMSVDETVGRSARRTDVGHLVLD